MNPIAKQKKEEKKEKKAMTSQGKKKQTTEAKGRDERQWMEKINTEKGRNHRTRHRRREKAIAYHFFRSFRCPPTSYMRNLLPSI